MPRGRTLALTLLLGCARPPALAPTPASAVVALTFDDLPYQTVKGGAPGEADPVRRAAVSHAILTTLRARHVPATVFVNCANLAPGEQSVAAWRDAGMGVGNHTAHHVNANVLSVEDWLADAAACHADLAARGVTATAFRYPYLRQGKTAAERDALAAGIAALGERHAPVTVATSEWWLAAAYDRAKGAGDDALAAELADAAVAHGVEAIRAAQRLARERVGRDVPQVSLVHVNHLAADHLDALLDAFAAADVRVAPLDEVLADEIYARPDAYVGGSMTWLGHVDPPITGETWFGAEEDRLIERFGARVDALP